MLVYYILKTNTFGRRKIRSTVKLHRRIASFACEYDHYGKIESLSRHGITFHK